MGKKGDEEMLVLWVFAAGFASGIIFSAASDVLRPRIEQAVN